MHTDLLANGQIPDPFYGSSQSDLQWIDKTDWEYCCTFDAPELASYDNVRLVFEGVDCYADIRLNGELLHRTGNMFRTWKSDVKGLLKSRNNRLHVVFHSPVMQGLKNMAAYGSRLTANNDLGALGGLGPNKVSVFTRKSGYQYGWDLAPRYVTSGLWRPVALEAWNEARVEDFHVRTRSTGPRKAQMSASAALRTDAAGCYRIRILLNGKSILTADKRLDAGTHSIEEPFEIPSPRLWYPNGMGEPYLYDVELVLEKEGRELDRTAVRCGVRTVSLRCRDDADGRGRGFGFEINGIPVFCKGSNYVPADAFLPRISREKTEFLVRSAAQANMNMLRVWGGGTYESDDFYEMCDRYGIMVWQDFVFACNMYPGSAQIYADIRARSRRQRTPAAQPPVARPLVRQQRNRRSMETPRQTQQPVPQILYGRRGRTVRPRKRNHLPEYPARCGGQPLRRHRTLLALVALAGLGTRYGGPLALRRRTQLGRLAQRRPPYRPTIPKSPVSPRNTGSNPTPNTPRSSVSSPKGSAASPPRP